MALRKTLFKYKLYEDQEFFDRACGYVRLYYRGRAIAETEQAVTLEAALSTTCHRASMVSAEISAPHSRRSGPGGRGRSAFPPAEHRTTAVVAR